MKLCITVPALPPSNNEFMGNSHSFHPYREKKTEWHWRIKAAIQKKPARPFRKAVVRLHYCFPDKIRRDPDNYSGKFILDALVREGILADDSFSVVTLLLSAEVDRQNPRTEIVVEGEEGWQTERL